MPRRSRKAQKASLIVTTLNTRIVDVSRKKYVRKIKQVTSNYFIDKKKKTKEVDEYDYLEETSTYVLPERPWETEPLMRGIEVDEDFELVKTPIIPFSDSLEGDNEAPQVTSSQEFRDMMETATTQPNILVCMDPPLTPIQDTPNSEEEEEPLESTLPVKSDSPQIVPRDFTVPEQEPITYYIVIFKSDAEPKYQRNPMMYAFTDKTRAISYTWYRLWEAHAKYHMNQGILKMHKEPGSLYTKALFPCLNELSDIANKYEEPTNPRSISEVLTGQTTFYRDTHSRSELNKDQTYATSYEALRKYTTRNYSATDVEYPVAIFPTSQMVSCITKHTDTFVAIYSTTKSWVKYQKLYASMKVTTMKRNSSKKMKDYKITTISVARDVIEQTTNFENNALIQETYAEKVKLDFVEESGVYVKYVIEEIPVVEDNTPFWTLCYPSDAFSFKDMPIIDLQ
jgi:hypothetical protein